MAKLKNVVKNLSKKDYEAIFDQLMESGAEKSAVLLKLLREEKTNDTKIMAELEVNSNAYYTLRSRLNQKIENYLLDQMENPRTDLLKKVSNINEIIFTKKKAIVVATLRKLEKELIDYDLSNELTIIYKALKKLNIHSDEYFNYSQLYNRHIAYMVATDKVEDQLAQYFKIFSRYALTNEPTDRMQIEVLADEITNTCNLYKSHRLYVYKSCLNIFNRLFVRSDDIESPDEEPIEDILANLVNIFDTYYLDTVYHNLKMVFNFLKLEYYNHYKLYRKAEIYFEEVNQMVSNLLSNYNLVTFPAQFLYTKLSKHLRLRTEASIYEEDKELFEDFECDPANQTLFVIYHTYRALGCYYNGKYEESSRWIYSLLNTLSLKNYPRALMEIKLFLALNYCYMQDFELFNQTVNSVQRQIRLLNEEGCEHAQLFIKIMKTAISDKKEKPQKMRSLIEKLNIAEIRAFSPIRFIRLDDGFILTLIQKSMA